MTISEILKDRPEYSEAIEKMSLNDDIEYFAHSFSFLGLEILTLHCRNNRIFELYKDGSVYEYRLFHRTDLPTKNEK